MILILTNQLDISADYVVRILRNNKMDFLRLNTETLPKKTITTEFEPFTYRLSDGSREMNLADEVRSIWLRRPAKPFENQLEKPSLPEPVIRYVEDQWRTYVEGLSSIEGIFWINNPHHNRKAENKIRQLRLATQVGLKIPRTCITSDKNEASQFYDQCNGKIVAKALDTPLIEYPDKDYFIFTNKIESLEGISEEEFSICPTILQEMILPKLDYRVTIVGDQCFPVKIAYPEASSQVDWRMNKDNVVFEESELPKAVLDGCLELVNRLGLVFGAIDLVQSNDQYYFLEINPNGEWGWLQKQGIPIAEAIADYLIKGNENERK